MKKTKEIACDDNALKEMFRDYRRMSPQIRRALEARGFIITKRKHWILQYENQTFTLPSSASDHRSGMNFFCILRRSLHQQSKTQ